MKYADKRGARYTIVVGEDELRTGVGQLKEMAASYGFDIGRPAGNVKEAIQWLYFGYLGAIKEQNVQAPAGTVGALPVENGQEKQYTGKISGRLVTPEEFGNITTGFSGAGAFSDGKLSLSPEVGAVGQCKQRVGS